MCEIIDVPVELISRDPYNPRNEPPTDELIESLKQNGVLSPVTGRKDTNGGYYATDGWERVQGAIIAGVDVVPFEIHPDALSAMRAGNAKSITRGWTKYDTVVNINNYYRACRARGLTHKQALHKTAKDNTKHLATISRYVRIWELPDGVRILFKSPSKRTQDEWNYLLKYNNNIRRYNETLSTVVADYLMKYIHDVPDDRLIDIACNVIGKKKHVAKQVVSEATRPYNLNKPIRDIFNIVKTGCDKPVGINLPSHVYLPSDKKDMLLKYMADRRMKINDFIRYLFDKCIADEIEVDSNYE